MMDLPTKDQLADDLRRTIDILKASNRQLSERVAEADLMSRYKVLVKYYDEHNGTPCEQIRHAQEVESLQARLAEVERERDELRGKAIQFDLDKAGISRREQEAVELVELRAQRDTLQREHAELKAGINPHGQIDMVAMWSARGATIAQLERENERLREALEFYADPETYFACTFLFDTPTGGFDEDFDETHGHEHFDRPMPGKLAREALHSARPGEAS